MKEDMVQWLPLVFGFTALFMFVSKATPHTGVLSLYYTILIFPGYSEWLGYV